MVFGKRRKVDLELELDREAYRPGDAIGVTVVVRGEEPERVSGGELLLRCVVERRWREGADLADVLDGDIGDLIPTEKRQADMSDLKAPIAIDGTDADGSPRLVGTVTLPGDAPASVSRAERSVEWRLQVFVKRKGMDLAARAVVAVAAPSSLDGA